MMDALPEQLNHWQANALYIIGDKPVLQDIPEDLYPNCTFVPVEVSESLRCGGEGDGERGGREREREGKRKRERDRRGEKRREEKRRENRDSEGIDGV